MLETTEDIKSLLQENLTLTREVHRTMRSVRRYILWGRVLDTAKFLFVIGAIAGAYFFIQPYLKQALGFYQELLGGSKDAGAPNGPADDGKGNSPFNFKQVFEGLKNPQ